MSWYGNLSGGVEGQYGEYHTYPVGSTENDIEGATKLYSNFSSPQQIFRRATFGLSRMVGQDILDELNSPEYLERVISTVHGQFEQKHNTSLMPRYVKQTLDSDSSTRNYGNASYMRLDFWPATHIELVQVAYPHGESTDPTFTYAIPPWWVALKENYIHIVPDFGFIPYSIDGRPATEHYPILMLFQNRVRNPSQWIVKYRYGFPVGKVPTTLVECLDLRCIVDILREVASVMFPNTSITTSIDSVSQSASTPGPDLLLKKADELERKADELESSLVGSHGSNITLEFIR